ncbi:unnamed protein product [Caenorhabditis angaria]|uniref:ZP domain-containing protein n=1 Tax=Caenorhabditis angaria TaxID=860376 RepID=A0A9P1NAL1_9PELO|nr:unnamed protein product [Caenorhabditis angaria]
MIPLFFKSFIIVSVFRNLYTSQADLINNGLTGEPIVQCGSESLSIQFKTQSAFEGHTYVKGHYSTKQCRNDATLEPSVNLTIPYSTCDVLRQRSTNPRGIMITTTVIISFHPMFITKIDKSYKVQCFYAEAAKTVTQQFNVDIGKDQEKKIFVMVGDEESGSSNNTQQDQRVVHDPEEERFNYNVPLPECNYRVLANNKDGEPVKFATVGQLVYHEWSCEPIDKKESSPFCATVHSCSVKDETGKEVQLFDENGCAVDKYLINNLEYTNDLTGGQLSQVFKFADQPSVFFQCQIRLSLKDEDGVCRRSSDHCPATLRGKRSAEPNENDVDVVSQKMTVFDIDESLDANKNNNNKLGSELEQQLQLSKMTSDVCVSPSTASGLVAFLASTLLISLISVLLLCFRHQTVKVKLAS